MQGAPDAHWHSQNAAHVAGKNYSKKTPRELQRKTRRAFDIQGSREEEASVSQSARCNVAVCYIQHSWTPC